jgi:hypothetical protein
MRRGGMPEEILFIWYYFASNSPIFVVGKRRERLGIVGNDPG